MRPRLISCYFGLGHEGQWPRLARVLTASAAEHCAAWDRSIVELPIPERVARVDESSLANTVKLRHWVQAVRESADETPVLLIDTDTVILHNLDDVWSRDFDLAYTTRPSSCRFPFNAGVVFLRARRRVVDFLEKWLAANELMLIDRKYHEFWRRQYGGINQAALGAVLSDRTLTSGLQLLELPCAEWNCEDTGWATFDPAITRILHVKSTLRSACFNLAPAPALKPLVNIWRDLERSLAGVQA